MPKFFFDMLDGVPFRDRIGIEFKTNADAIAFLHTTVLPGGAHAKGPMPRYMFSVADATTIVTYLRTLK